MGLLATLEVSSRPLLLTAGGIVLFILITVVAASLLPWLLRQLRAETDLFLMLSVASGLVLAGLGARVFDVPLALAAFVAGLAVGESPAADEARQRLVPFRDIFAVMFFVTIGTLIDPRAIPDSLEWFGIVLGLIVFAKVGVIFTLARLLRLREVNAWQVAIGLGQIGEFSYVLAAVGVSKSVIPSELFTALLSAVAVSIAISAVAVRLRPGVAARSTQR